MRVGSPHTTTIHYSPLPVLRIYELRKKAIMSCRAFHTALGKTARLFGNPRKWTLRLFDRSPRRDEPTRPAFLMELRQFRQQHSDNSAVLKGCPSGLALAGLTQTRREHRDLHPLTAARCFFTAFTSAQASRPPAWSRRPRLPVSTSKKSPFLKRP